MNKELITSFYEAFQRLDGKAMADHYHELAYFSDPVFKNLSTEEAGAMWQMLIDRSKGELDIQFHSVEETEDTATCIWEARYAFSQTKRRVHNVIKSKMTFEEGKIILHEDQFDFWKWSRMALGISGVLLGWTPFLKDKVRAMARNGLNDYMNKQPTK